MSYAAIFLASFVYVMLRAFQQRNVAFDAHWWVIPTSYGMAVLDIYLISSFARQGWGLALVFVYGSAGALGSLFAMWFHKRYVTRSSK